MRPRLLLLFALLIATRAAFSAPLVIEGEVPEEGDHFEIPFEVPAGTVELEVRHDDLSSANILDWGLRSPDGFRGYGGGNTEPAIVGEAAASRSYLAGPMTAGTWKVTVGKAQIKERPARYRVEVELRTAPTLSPQPERSPYAHAAPLNAERRWYAGDFHVHSLESGDARPSLDDVAALARSRGLDFVALSDHNTSAHYDFIADAQARHPGVLLVPSVEFTTYQGHANAFGATRYVDPRIGFGEVTLASAIAEYAAQGAIFTINHPTLDIGSGCIGCAWDLPLSREGVGAVEIGVGGWDTTGALFDEAAIAFWDRLCDRGLHVTAVGGSDDHRAGVNLNQTQSPIGDPTTMVLAENLSVPALLDAVRAGRTVVKLRGPGDPMIVLEATGDRRGDTVVGPGATLRAEVAGAKGHTFRWVNDGAPEEELYVDSDPFTVEREVHTPDSGQTRWRAEVLVGHRPRTVTSHIWFSQTYPAFGEVRTSRPLPSTCSAIGGGGALALLACAAAFALRVRKPS